MRFEPDRPGFRGAAVALAGVEPLIDGAPAAVAARTVGEGEIVWRLGAPFAGARMVLRIHSDVAALRLSLELVGLAPDQTVDSLGLRFAAAEGAERWFRNGYYSWDGSWFAAPGEPGPDDTPGRSPALGYAVTALLPAAGPTLILGFTRHDRFQSRFRFFGEGPFGLDVETLWDRAPHEGSLAAEPLVMFENEDQEEGLRAWARLVAAESPTPPRIPERRITGWCSWYSLYAAIDEAVILEHLQAAAAFRDRHRVPLDVFQIDDGFTPEMGDWLEVKPQFPRGMKPVLDEIAAAGFTPGLWIAPFMVGNRSRLYREHPDWVVKDRATGAPIAHMTFYGEFRWHKRSEEYHILDITHPEAEAYIRRVFRTWRREWGCGYFKTDFMQFGSEYGPDRAAWHVDGLSRIAIWRRMGELIREEIGDAVWLGCGCPLWVSVGLVDGIRIGRDVGVRWKGDQSAESLLRDQVTRNHASGILWQADPDCVLLRDRFHELSEDQVRSLALFAGLAGGVLMTSDKLDELRPDRAELFAALLREPKLACSFPNMARQLAEGLIVQQATRPNSGAVMNLFNTRGEPVATRGGALGPHASRLIAAAGDPLGLLEGAPEAA